MRELNGTPEGIKSSELLLRYTLDSKSQQFFLEYFLLELFLPDTIDLKLPQRHQDLFKESWVDVELSDQDLCFMVMFLDKFDAILLMLELQVDLVSLFAEGVHQG